MYAQTGMTKLIMSNQLPEALGAHMRFIEDPQVMEKSAATIFGCDYGDMLPDKHHVGIHVVGLGAFESYGSNRNGDGFPKSACAKYHHTFVKNGHVYRNHQNKDPKKALGSIIKTAFNEAMGRVELFLHVHKDKAADELQKLAREGELPWSMACRVPHDRCNICGTLRKTASDPNQCDHVRFELRNTRRDGSIVCTQNDKPNFFDMSMVGRPADRIAWDLYKVASDTDTDSVKLAEMSGLWVPDHLMITADNAKAKQSTFKKLARYQEEFKQFAANAPRSARGRHMWELRKAAGYKVADEHIDMLRCEEPERVYAKLAAEGIVLPADAFFKYAFGIDYGELAPYMGDILNYVRRGTFIELEKTGGYQNACINTYFDVDPARVLGYCTIHNPEVDVLVTHNMAKTASFVGHAVDQRVIDRTIAGDVMDLRYDAGLLKLADGAWSIVEKSAEIYGTYKLSAIHNIMANKIDEHALLALAAAQDLIT